MDERFDITADYGAKENASIIKVIGVGGGGSNAVRHMYSEGIVGVDFLVCNTDRGHLEKSPVPSKLLLGNGLGAGAVPEIARQFATESKEKIAEFIGKETKMLFITAGMGKGTGTGASPVVAEVAKSMGILTIGVVTTPFKFEGKQKASIAEKGIEELAKHVDSLIVVQNQNILKCYQDQNILKAYGYADDVLKNAVKCIAELITVDYIQNVDFNDVQTVMKDSGKAMLGIATASGENRVEKVVEEALSCPLLDTAVIKNAQNFLFFISYGPEANFTAAELEELTDKFYDLQDDDAHIIWGNGIDETLGDAIKLSVIITKFNTPAEEIITPKSETVITEHEDVFKTQEEIGEVINGNAEDIQQIINSKEEEPVAVHTEPAKSTEQPQSPVFTFENDQVVAANVPTLDDIRNSSFDQPTIIQGPAQYGPMKIEDSKDAFSSEAEYQKIVETPAIIRAEKLQASSKAVATTMEYCDIYEVQNDFKDFFSDIAD
ncbi:MAG: cell division protein FtsZ [Bacteroidales bacterium]|nr:cell division protein FtsZ [Bacteroidales bacterium]